jgi:hypothetical protein
VASIFQKQMFAQLNQLKSNPVQFLLERKFNINQNVSQSPKQMIESITGIPIPNEYANNPHGYFEYLMTNGQLSQQQIAQFQNNAKFFNF